MPQPSKKASSGPGVHVILRTHTDQHLANSLLSLVQQSPAPASITVSVDGEHATVQDVVETTAHRTGVPMNCVTRRHMGEARRTQTSNNGARALFETGVADDDWLLFMDGDCLAVPGLIAAHTENARFADFSCAYFINLTEDETNSLTEEDILGGQKLIDLCEPHREQLNERQRRLERQLSLRRFRLVKRHKPKCVGGHIAVRVSAFVSINGFDEAYTAWGFEDDDYTYRLYQKRFRPGIVVTKAILLHQWHKTLRESDWLKNQSAKRFRGKWRRPAFCAMGLTAPKPQAEPICRRFGGSTTR